MTPPLPQNRIPSPAAQSLIDFRLSPTTHFPLPNQGLMTFDSRAPSHGRAPKKFYPTPAPLVVKAPRNELMNWTEKIICLFDPHVDTILDKSLFI